MNDDFFVVHGILPERCSTHIILNAVQKVNRLLLLDAGKETVQVYLVPKERTGDEPVRQLKGFEKIFLDAGESGRVRIENEDYYGGMEIQTGSSLKDIRLYTMPDAVRPLP